MYDNHFAEVCSARRHSLISAFASALAVAVLASNAAPAAAQTDQPEAVIRKVSNLSDKLELTTNSSRILTLDKNIPRVQVNNPDLVAVTPLSAKEIQISAKKAGVTQVNLWDDQGGIHSIDVQIYGDARELTAALQTQFPHSSIKVYRYSESLVLTGFVDRPDHVGPIMRMAEDYSPKVINNISVGGVQQVLLKVKVMEISRTKLKQLGFDWAWFGGGNHSFAVSRPGGLISAFSSGAQSVETLGDTFNFGIIGDSGAFFGVLDALQNHQVARILAEPNIVAVSGRPAQFNVGGEVPILVPQSLGTTSIEYKPFGTQIDFLPIVLGDGSIRLEVRPRVSFLDPTSGIQLNEIVVPGFNVRQVDTAVEMKAGQTFALAGLTQERTETRVRGLPYLADVPVLGVPFRKTRDEVNEIELLIIVTPELVDPMDRGEVPCGGPGTFTVSPTDRGLYCGGQVEVPSYCNPRQGLHACGQDPCESCSCNNGGGCSTCNGGGMPGGGAPVQITDGNLILPGGTGYDDSPNALSPLPAPVPADSDPVPTQLPAPGSTPTPPQPKPEQGAQQDVLEDITLPIATGDEIVVTPKSNPVAAPTNPLPPQTPKIPAQPAATPPQAPPPGGSARTFVPVPQDQPADTQPTAMGQGGQPQYTAPRPYSPQRQPVFMRNATRPYNPQTQPAQPAAPQRENSLIGPVGYDVQ